MINISNITYKIGQRNILEDVSLSVRPGEFVCLMGSNGAGKSTLLRLICGLLNPSCGAVTIKGRPLNSYKKKELATVMSYVPQVSPADIHFSAEEYVMTGRYPYQSPLSGISETDRAIVEEVLETASIKELRKRDISTLSGGERQRVMIAAALAQDTEILLLDEPTIYLDPKSAVDILELLSNIHAGGRTVVMVTHDINQALMFGTVFIGIKAGQILFRKASPEALAESRWLNALFDLDFTLAEGSMPPQVLFYRRNI